jgi:hypothetical protein
VLRIRVVSLVLTANKAGIRSICIAVNSSYVVIYRLLHIDYVNVCCLCLTYVHVYLDCALVAADVCSVISDGLRLLPLLLLVLPIVSSEGGAIFNSSSTPAACSRTTSTACETGHYTTLDSTCHTKPSCTCHQLLRRSA